MPRFSNDRLEVGSWEWLEVGGWELGVGSVSSSIIRPIPVPFGPGTRLGAYEVTAQIGVGGMGEVYRAFDTKLDRHVAIKILPESFAQDPDRLARFEREAKVLASLNHPNIGAIYGLEEAEGLRALVLELVEGPTLADRIAEGPIAVGDALPIARQIAEAIEAAHEHGIIHRDLKPANVKVREDATVKVLDFGLAKAMTSQDATRTIEPIAYAVTASPTITTPAMTQVGVILGTAAYMSPEQAKGHPADKRSDVWAFGCVLFEMLSGRRAFEGNDVSDTLASVLKSEPDWTSLPASVPPLVRLAIQRCLQKNRAHRMADMSGALFAMSDHSLAAASAEKSAPPPQHRPWLPILITAALSGAVVGIGVWTLRAPAPAAPLQRYAYTLPEDQSFSDTFLESVAISHDGSQIAYVANKRVYLRSLSELTARPIAGTETPTNLGNIAFAPDGQSIAFWARTGSPGRNVNDPIKGEIKRVSTAGGAPLTLARIDYVPQGLSWEGESLVFGQANHIVRISANGSQPETIVRVKDDEQVQGPQVLPGGDAVLFTVKAGLGLLTREQWDDADIVVESLTSHERKALVKGNAAHYLPTGHLVFARAGLIFAVPFDPDRLQTTGSPVPVVEGVHRTEAFDLRVVRGGAHFAVSDNGTAVYVPGPISGNLSTRQMILIDRAGNITPLRLPAGSYESTRVSPDGKQVAVVVNENGTSHISVYELSGAAGLRRLTLEGNNRFPTWSSDGQRITFQSDREGDLAIFQQRADGTSAAERLTVFEKDVARVPGPWLPDGSGFLFAEIKNRASTVWTYSMRDRKATRFGSVENKGPEQQGVPLSLSPDGRWIAYQANGLFVQPFPATGSVYPLPPGRYPRWSSDGTELLSTWGTQIGAIRITTQPFRFADRTPLRPEVSDVLAQIGDDYDILPDGKFVAAAAAGASGADIRQIHIIQNWFEEVKRLSRTQ
jgi:serine/threonine protein kinase/DNA-binding beta-propeller fold protein YncE